MINRILIVDDNEKIHEDFKKVLHLTSQVKDTETHELAKKILSKKSFGDFDSLVNHSSYQIDVALQGKEALEMVDKAAAEGRPYSLIFMDVRMPPGIDGIQTTKKIWKHHPRIEVVICTAYSDYSWEEIMGFLGDTDHLLFMRKPIDSVTVRQFASALTTKWDLNKKNVEHLEDLENEVEIATRELRSIIETLNSEILRRKESEEQLAYLSEFDSLTGLRNRRSFYDSIEKAVAHHDHLKSMFAVFFIDVDNFKPVNDLMGHDAGDILLRNIADRLSRILGHKTLYSSDSNNRQNQNIFRLGGDEFVGIISSEDDDGAPALANKVIESINEPFIISGREVNISCSIGISVFPQDSTGAKELITFADLAMYRAKEQKGSFVFYDEVKDKAFLSQLALEDELKKALSCGQIGLYYQSLLNKEKILIGIAALARWEHPARGTVMPSDFLSLADNSVQSLKIGEYILKAACAHLKTIHKRGFADVFTLVNCGVRQFYDPRFIHIVESALNENCLDPKHLVLGLDWDFFSRDPERSITIIKTIREKGVHLTVDGFGKGRSELGFLQYLPRDTIIKIHRGYVKNISSKKEDKEFLYRMIDMLKSRNLNAIVSGIETPEQYEIIKEKDCILQGFLFDRPSGFDDFLSGLLNE